MRNLIFISHSNPDDNAFAQWLGLQLTREGYLIWSDITKLIGGEIFWNDIEEAIRNFTFKFIFILSKSSNIKQGTLDELHLAKTTAKTNNLDDFIIPIRIDDLPFSEINVALHRVNAIDFNDGWWQGFSNLLEKLETDKTPRDAGKNNSELVSLWWSKRVDGQEILIAEPENLASNWFPIVDMPEYLYVHSPTSGKFNYTRGRENLPYPVYPIRQSIISFAQPEDLLLNNIKTMPLSSKDILSGTFDNQSLRLIEAQNALIYLLRNSWLKLTKSLNLPLHNLSNRRYCNYFLSTMFDKKLQSFELSKDLTGRRSLVGKDKGRIWHFGISVDFQIVPIPALIVWPHVIFSDDGINIWKSTDRLHRARRSACKDWWNPHWRDRLFASIFWIANKQGNTEELRMAVAKEASITISTKPMIFESPISYTENFVTTDDIDDEDVLDEDTSPTELEEE